MSFSQEDVEKMIAKAMQSHSLSEQITKGLDAPFAEDCQGKTLISKQVEKFVSEFINQALIDEHSEIGIQIRIKIKNRLQGMLNDGLLNAAVDTAAYRMINS